MSGLNPVLARHLGRRQVRSKALGDDLALLLPASTPRRPILAIENIGSPAWTESVLSRAGHGGGVEEFDPEIGLTEGQLEANLWEREGGVASDQPPDPVVGDPGEDRGGLARLLQHHVVPDRRREAVILVLFDAVEAGRAGREDLEHENRLWHDVRSAL